MQVAKVEIENFRHVKHLELDFTDSVGRVRDVSLLVGPNTCGKTTVLDALALGLGVPTELSSHRRPDLVLTPAIVRRGALQARVTCQVRFSQEEIETTREVYRLAEEEQEIPNVDKATITWEYPDRRGQYPLGYSFCEPREAWHLFKGRVKVARLLFTERVDPSWFERVGGVFTFDQQRTGMSKVIPPAVWQVIHGGENGEDAEKRRTKDPRELLVSLAVQSLVPLVEQRRPDQFVDQFERIRERYAEVCAPHRIKGIVRDELDQYDIIFADGDDEYRYDGLSSGEQMVLLFLIRMVTDRIHQSVVLVDEIELHQHPIWQRKLLYQLPRIGKNNQIIATTHSPYLRDVVQREAIIDLGELGDQRQQEECRS